MIRRLLIANRAEIAVRIIRTCRELGVETVAVYSEGDRGALHAQLADRAVCIGPARSSESYLNAQALVAAALGTRCEAIHPGYGFLAENAAFARLCEEHGQIFVGPTPESIDLMGSKIQARLTAREIGVPTIPGSEGGLRDVEHAREAATQAGFPLLLKATAGGGGRGMRIVREPAALESAFSEASSEALAAFGDGTLYAERFLEGVRHVEVQVVGNGRDAFFHVGERDCSAQRRSQKLLEEAPAAALPARTRQAMLDAALAIARHISYRGLGTVEFVYDPAADSFAFLEMNTRIQVEHPVTEMVSGLDLVAEQLRVASGESLSFSQSEVVLRGHAIECRINAEDPDAGFRPSPGRITAWQLPSGPGVRIDTQCFEGYAIPPFYDSMIAKLIVHAESRAGAIARMRAALDAFHIEGPKTTLEFHRRLLADPRFERNEIDTKWVEREFLPEVPTA